MGFWSIRSPDGKKSSPLPFCHGQNSISLNTATPHTVPTSCARPLLRRSMRWASDPRKSPEPLLALQHAELQEEHEGQAVLPETATFLNQNRLLSGLHHFQVSSSMTLAFSTGLSFGARDFGARDFGAHLRFLEVRWSRLGLFWLRGDVVLKCEHLHLAAHTSSQGINALQDVSLHKTTARPGPWHPSRFNVFSWVLHPQPSLGNFSSPPRPPAVLSDCKPVQKPSQIQSPPKIPNQQDLRGCCFNTDVFPKSQESPKSMRLPKSRCPAQAQKQLGGPRGAVAGHPQALLHTSCSWCLRNQPRKEKKFGLCPSSLTQSVHSAGQGGKWGCATSPQHPSSTV